MKSLLVGWQLYVIIAVLIIGISLSLFFWGRSSGSDKIETPDPIKLPSSGSGLPAGWSALTVAKKLYNAMSGISYSFPKVKAQLEGLTDDQLAAVYNEFNNQYYSEGDGDLFEWFDNEVSWWPSDHEYVDALFQGVV